MRDGFSIKRRMGKSDNPYLLSQIKIKRVFLAAIEYGSKAFLMFLIILLLLKVAKVLLFPKTDFFINTSDLTFAAIGLLLFFCFKFLRKIPLS